ncbi:hypothetical protein DEO72_LG3g2705 [Vigna unguiculata]|uniref:Uncharacterized protein n=1 Tax=Vigna unguiculata TaxID=3917 RepID=A0A4D6LHY0_VIGUN|nr:hypothetical protein DEO72_LG3g2705 [Vigna unguiculata]
MTIIGTVLLSVCVSERFASLISRYGELGFELGETRARTDNLAQASLEEARPNLFREKSPRRPAHYFERVNHSPRRRGTRLSETVSPERGAGRDRMRPYTHGEVVINGMDSTCDTNELGGEQLGSEQRYPPQVQASAKSDQIGEILVANKGMVILLLSHLD